MDTFLFALDHSLEYTTLIAQMDTLLEEALIAPVAVSERFQVLHSTSWL